MFGYINLPVMTATWPFNPSSWLSEMAKLVIASSNAVESRENVNGVGLGRGI
jgi:hypothetical protein